MGRVALISTWVHSKTRGLCWVRSETERKWWAAKTLKGQNHEKRETLQKQLVLCLKCLGFW